MMIVTITAVCILAASSPSANAANKSAQTESSPIFAAAEEWSASVVSNITQTVGSAVKKRMQVARKKYTRTTKPRTQSRSATQEANLSWSNEWSCKITSISDGDSLIARCNGINGQQKMRIRISGIDAPEREQPYYQESKRMLSRLCLNQTARIRRVDTDRYQRTVAHVHCQDTDMSQHMVRSGLAWVYTQYAQGRTDLPPLQQQAQSRRLGLWQMIGSQTPPIAPWEWRKMQREQKSGKRTTYRLSE